jgi:hypothetical protein
MAKERTGPVLAWHGGSQRCFIVAKSGSSCVLGGDGRDSNKDGVRCVDSLCDFFGVDEQHDGTDLLREVARCRAGWGRKDVTVTETPGGGLDRWWRE